jgi:hypothetical protein
MPELPSQTLVAELCYLAPPALSAAELLAAMRAYRPDAELVDGERGAILVSYRAVRDQYPESRSAPLVSGVTTAVADHSERDLRHTAWAQAGEALARCRYSLLVTEFVRREVDSAVRVAAFQSALRAMVETTRPLATWWPASQQAVEPEVAAADPLRGAVNIRHFPDLDEEEVSLLDTLGLAQLGLPDLQCHYRHLSTELLAERFGQIARELAGGATPPTAAIRGITLHQRWPVYSAPALRGPTRPVLTVDPGAPFVVAERTRRGTDSRHQAYD